MIADLRVVEDAFVELHPIFLQRFLCVTLQHTGKILESPPNDREIILRQGPRVGARIGQHFMLFVERLRDIQRALGRETVPTVRFAL